MKVQKYYKYKNVRMMNEATKVSLMFPKALLKSIKEKAKNQGISMGEFTRRALEEYEQKR